MATDIFTKTRNYDELWKNTSDRALAFQGLLLHLYNAQQWPIDMAYICRMEELDWKIAMEMLNEYRLNGERNCWFMHLGHELAEKRLNEKQNQPEHN